MKSQVIIDKNTKQILSCHFAPGKTHDFKLFKQSKVVVNPRIKILSDSGYQGLQKKHANSILPKKKSKKRPLTKEDKLFNRTLSSARVAIENVFAVLKKFKIIASIYRNRRKKFNQRFTFLSGLFNFELSNKSFY